MLLMSLVSVVFVCVMFMFDCVGDATRVCDAVSCIHVCYVAIVGGVVDCVGCVVCVCVFVVCGYAADVDAGDAVIAGGVVRSYVTIVACVTCLHCH